jgi:hypothetical protein
MMRLSATLTRVAGLGATGDCVRPGVGKAVSPNTPVAARADMEAASDAGCTEESAPRAPTGGAVVVVGSSFQLSIIFFRWQLLAGFALFETRIARSHGAGRPENFGIG